ncbi:hypothetical protein SLS63_010580 [Diaporthe eres]|uniref:Protein kinase domain-containing protein n=1 Tax=Diaporthe eres TaxID=83184 RepID=A0ABR1NWI9_DIAER
MEPPRGIRDSDEYDTDSESMTSDDTTPGEDMAESLARKVEQSLFDHKKEFWPRGSIDGIITRDRVRDMLKSGRRRSSKETQETRKAEQEGLDRLADFISKKGKKLFAIMLYGNISNRDIRQAMTQFQQHRFDDGGLPVVEDAIAQVFRSSTNKAYRKPWNHVRVKAFCANQWKFLAPTFDNKRIEMTLDSNHILPFTKASQRAGVGTFGEVHEVTVHPAHRRNVVHNSSVAVKKLHRAYTEDEGAMRNLEEQWQKEVKAHKEISKCNHPNIIGFMTAITRDYERYLMFEWANGGNLRQFWHSHNPRLTRTLVEDIMHQLCGLAGALEEIHFRSYRHGDMKPENILRVKTPGHNTSKLDVGTLKICDMGLTKYHYLATQLREQATDTKFTTFRYEPPESTEENKAWPRRYDVWSIGCIMLEFLVWMVWGKQELEEFNKRIVNDFGKQVHYFELEKRNGQTSCRVQPRADSRALKMALDEIIERGNKNRSYWLKGESSDDLPSLCTPQVVESELHPQDILTVARDHSSGSVGGLSATDGSSHVVPILTGIVGVQKLGPLPTRLIHVGANDSDTINLCITQPEDKFEYIALSHPWGEGPHFCTTLDNVEAYRNKIDFGELPVMFQDAVVTTRKLGLEYLWIDSICIIQGEGGDFDQEAKKMEDVFSSAFCVIAASSAQGQHDGFLNRPRQNRECLTFERAGLPPLYVSRFMDDFNKDVLESPLSKRGWVLQERALARRTIYFTDNQIYWECGRGVRSEMLTKMDNKLASFLGDPNFPSKLSNDATIRGVKIRLYEGLYRQYTRLQFTRISDRPFAIAGLERRLIRDLRAQGGFGIFDDGRSLFHHSLLWQRGREVPPMAKIPSVPSLPVPSWSWMGYDGGIDFVNLPLGGVHWYTDAIKSPWVTEGPGTCHTGDGKEFVELKAWARPFAPGSVGLSPTDEIELVCDCQDTVDLNNKDLMCVVVGREKRSSCDIEEMAHFVLIVTGSKEALRSKEGNPVCERVGVGRMKGKYLNLQSSPEAVVIR